MNKIPTTGLDESTVEKIIAITRAVAPNAKIYLFGSRAKGTFHERSDIDLAIDTGKKMPIIDVGEIRDILNASNMLYRFDVVDLNGVDERLRSIILKEGIVWKAQ